MKKPVIKDSFRVESFTRKTDHRNQQYLVYPEGQLRRISPDGTAFLPRIRMTKKQRLKLRRQYNEIKDLDYEEMADKILKGTLSINPNNKFDCEPPSDK
jgi:hypothetical protein